MCILLLSSANMFSTLYPGQRTTEVRSFLTMWTLDDRLRLSGLVADAFMCGTILCVICSYDLDAGKEKRVMPQARESSLESWVVYSRQRWEERLGDLLSDLNVK